MDTFAGGDVTGRADAAEVARAPRPGTVRLAAGVLAGSGTAAVAAAAVVRRRRSRAAAVRDLLHHRLLPTLQAGERAITAGDIDAASQHLRAAVVLSRTALDPHGTPPEPVMAAVEEARRVWAEGLQIDDDGVTALPSRLPLSTRRALHAITLEALANVARHSTAPTARVATGAESDHVLLTVAANGPPRLPCGDGRPVTSMSLASAASGSDGYGLPSLERIAEEAGGSLETSFDRQGSIVVARLPCRRAWRRR